MAPKHKPVQIVVIVWKDAVADTGWKLAADVEQAHTCTSIGMVVADSDESVVLAGTWSQGDDGMETNNRITIPKGWVVSQKKVKV